MGETRLKKVIFESWARLKAVLSPHMDAALRHKGVLAVILAISLSYMIIAAGIGRATVGSTKHNFGSLSPAAVKTTDSSEICVFCHAPHNSAPAGPIWNRQESGANYNVYESQTLAATLSPNSPMLGQPTGSSKLCLSCHDGTIAVGSVLNLPGKGIAGTLAVTGPGIDVAGRISPASTSYIGTDLRDDHPISFDYSLSYPNNSEIKPDTSFPPQVKLDSNNRVQCVSCHDPHGTPYPKFMVTTLENGTLCDSCHQKRYWGSLPSVHKTSISTWSGAVGVDPNPWNEDMGAAGYADDTPQMQSCLSCHRSHGGASGKMLLKRNGEEDVCFACHNGKLASKNMEPLFSYPYKHDVRAAAGLHVPSRQTSGDPVTETAANLGINRHAECEDCHNSHGSIDGNHASGINGNIIGPSVLGSWGVKPAIWPAAGDKAISYSTVYFNTLNPGANNLEGYLCLKCHSYYAYGDVPPVVPSGNADGSYAVQSDPTADFNVNNMGYHPVFTDPPLNTKGRNQPPVDANTNWPLNNLGLTNTFRYVEAPGTGGYYNVTHDSVITCTDCHGSGNAADPKGPHGSNNRWILRNNETGLGTYKNFCYNCHRREVYGDEDYVGPKANFSRVPHPADGRATCPDADPNPVTNQCSPFYRSGIGTGNDGNRFGILCLTCHGGNFGTDIFNNTVMKGIHGSNAPAGAAGAPLGYRMMNGACVTSYTRPSIASRAEMTFKAAADSVCNNVFDPFNNGNFAIYNCNNIADCSF